VNVTGLSKRITKPCVVIRTAKCFLEPPPKVRLKCKDDTSGLGQSLPRPASSKSGHVRYASKADGLADCDSSLPTCRTGSEVPRSGLSVRCHFRKPSPDIVPSLRAVPMLTRWRRGMLSCHAELGFVPCDLFTVETDRHALREKPLFRLLKPDHLVP
jgi:hypothetical protein